VDIHLWFQAATVTVKITIEVKGGEWLAFAFTKHDGTVEDNAITAILCKWYCNAYREVKG
jgi:hypothetical protein